MEAPMLKTVLLVDDDTSLTDNLEDILQEEGYSLCTASTCAEACNVMLSCKPRAALLDIKLPDGSGTQLLSELKRLDPDCIFSIMTAYADLDSALAALHQGAFHYIQKPVRPTELLALLDRVFATIRLREEKRQAEQKLRESEERFRMVFDTAHDSIFVKSKNSTYTLVNPSMAKLFSRQASDFIGKTDEELFGTEASAHLRRTDLQVLNGESVEEEHTHAVKGVPRTFHVIKVPMHDHSGNITGLIGIARDMTERKHLEAQLLQARKMEAVGTLAGGIAHDFNNLLQAIMGCAELMLLGKQLNEPGYRELDDIVNASRRGAELTKQLLTFSRKVESNRKPMDINEKVKDASRLLMRTIPKMIDIELNLQPNIKMISADPVQMEQVLMNLTMNARDAMASGGKVLIETRNVSLGREFCEKHLEVKQGDYVLLRVSDTGHGMDSTTVEHIFEPFYTTKEIGKGTGLGLAAVYGIVKGHDGHVFCESRVGSGTSFNVYIPAIEDAASPVYPPDLGNLEGDNDGILLVDDDEFMRGFGEAMLSRFGYRVMLAENAEKALDIYRERKDEIDLVILDLIMPGIGGRECLERLLIMDPGVKVLIASGYSPDWHTGGSRETRARGFISKPYELKKMLRTIRDVLRKP